MPSGWCAMLTSVSTFCNDLVGDVVGTLSGALGVALLLALRGPSPRLGETLATH